MHIRRLRRLRRRSRFVAHVTIRTSSSPLNQSQHQDRLIQRIIGPTSIGWVLSVKTTDNGHRFDRYDCPHDLARETRDDTLRRRVTVRYPDLSIGDIKNAIYAFGAVGRAIQAYQAAKQFDAFEPFKASENVDIAMCCGLYCVLDWLQEETSGKFCLTATGHSILNRLRLEELRDVDDADARARQAMIETAARFDMLLQVQSISSIVAQEGLRLQELCELAGVNYDRFHAQRQKLFKDHSANIEVRTLTRLIHALSMKRPDKDIRLELLWGLPPQEQHVAYICGGLNHFLSHSLADAEHISLSETLLVINTVNWSILSSEKRAESLAAEHYSFVKNRILSLLEPNSAQCAPDRADALFAKCSDHLSHCCNILKDRGD